MLHASRTHRVCEIDDPQKLAQMLELLDLHEGLQIQGYFFLNDSQTIQRDRFREFAVFKQEQDTLRQIDSITINAHGMTVDLLANIVERIISGARDHIVWSLFPDEPKRYLLSKKVHLS